MPDPTSLKDLQRRLKELSAKFEEHRAKLGARKDDAAARHMGHLVEIEKEHRALSQRVEQGDASGWRNFEQTYKADLKGLSDQFDRWVSYVDKEYGGGR